MSDLQGSDSLSNLLEQSKQLLATTTHSLPKSLTSLYAQSKKLSTEYAQADGTQAAYLLGRNGFDVKKYKNLLKKLKLKSSAFETQEPLFVTDIHGYLQHEHQMTILTSIEEAKKQSQSMLYANHNACVEENWRKAKTHFQNLLATKGIEKPQFSKWEPVGDSRMSLQSIGTRGRSVMTTKMKAFANVVLKLNQNGQDSHYPVIQEMKKTTETVDENPGRRQEISECWKLLKLILDEENAVFKAVTTPYEAYSMAINNGASQRSSDNSEQQKLEEKFINGSKRYLEEQYLNHIIEICSKHAHELNLSTDILRAATPQAIKMLIEAYVRHRFYIPSTREWRVAGISDLSHCRIQLSNGKPLWALIFFALRCGKRDLALEYASEFSGSADQDVKILPVLLGSNDPLRLDEVLQSQLAQKYRTSEYIFKRAVLLILGKLNADDALKVIFQKLEDFIWQKLMQIPNRKETSSQELSEQVSLAKLQEQIVTLGPSYFNVQKNRSSLIYFKLLLLIHEFERAIEYLCGRDLEGFGIEVVHFAIALDYYGVLQCSNNIDAPILEESPHGTIINLSFIIRNYVKQFAHTDPQEAVSYLCRISNKNHRIACIRDLVIESQDTSAILGSILQSGLRNKGIIEKMVPKNEFLSILKDAAAEYQRTGRHESAIDLHLLAAECEHGTPEASRHLTNCLQIIIGDLSRALSLNIPDKKNKIELARRVFERTSGNENVHHEWYTLEILLQLSEFFEDVKHNKFGVALEKLKQMRILPLDNLGIEEAYQNFSTLDKTVKENVADTVIEAMRCLQGLSHQYQDYRSQRMIQSNAAELLEFARRIDDETSKRIYGQLIHFDLYLHK